MEKRTYCNWQLSAVQRKGRMTLGYTPAMSVADGEICAFLLNVKIREVE